MWHWETLLLWRHLDKPVKVYRHVFVSFWLKENNHYTIATDLVEAMDTLWRHVDEDPPRSYWLTRLLHLALFLLVSCLSLALTSIHLRKLMGSPSWLLGWLPSSIPSQDPVALNTVTKGATPGIRWRRQCGRTKPGRWLPGPLGALAPLKRNTISGIWAKLGIPASPSQLDIKLINSISYHSQEP